MMLKRTPLLKERARSLRNSLTDAENVLWQAIKAREINGVKFRRQYIFQNYIVDFISFSPRLIIGVDGAQHLEQTEYDNIRTDLFRAGGYKVVRFWNHEVLHDLESVLEKIFTTICILSTPTPALPRRAREGA